MKVLFTILLSTTFCCLLVMPAVAQDYLDVEPGYETLNLAIEGDTTAAGEPVSQNRVYRLQRGGYYLLNGSIQNSKDMPLVIVAAEGDGALPIIIPATDETGASSRAFALPADCTLRNLYVSGIDNLGNQASKNMFRLEKTGGRYIVDGCFFDHDAQAFVRMNADDQKLYIYDSIFRNSILLAGPGNGRFIDTRGNTVDTMMVQNSTFYMCSSSMVRDGGGIIQNVLFDHVTVYQGNGNFAFNKVLNGHFNDCLIIDARWEGDVEPTDPAAALADSLETDIISIDSLNAPDLMSEGERAFQLKNNIYGWTPEVTEFIAGIDSLQKAVLFNARAQRYFDVFDGFVDENNVEDTVVFSDAPAPANVITFAQYRIDTGFSDENNPDPRADRNGLAALSEDPESIGPAPDEYDFDYNTDAQAYTHAAGGFPVGDLNWFPDKKAEWETWVTTDITENNATPSTFSMKQNYPNPFNPTTTIDFALNKSSQVELIVYNALGQKIRTLMDGKIQAAGTHSINWDGRNDNGTKVASGIYMYQIKAGNQVETKKMVLMK